MAFGVFRHFSMVSVGVVILVYISYRVDNNNNLLMFSISVHYFVIRHIYLG